MLSPSFCLDRSPLNFSKPVVLGFAIFSIILHDSACPPRTDALRQAAHLLHTLGWGVDKAYADVTPEQSGGDIYEPAVAGERRMTPMAGTLDDLKAAYQRFQLRSTGKGVDSDTRPSMLISQPYQRTGEEFTPKVCFRQMKEDDPTKAKAVAWEDCQKVAAWLRHRASEELRNEFDADKTVNLREVHVGEASVVRQPAVTIT